MAMMIIRSPISLACSELHSVAMSGVVGSSVWTVILHILVFIILIALLAVHVEPEISSFDPGAFVQ